MYLGIRVCQNFDVRVGAPVEVEKVHSHTTGESGTLTHNKRIWYTHTQLDNLARSHTMHLYTSIYVHPHDVRVGAPVEVEKVHSHTMHFPYDDFMCRRTRRRARRSGESGTLTQPGTLTLFMLE